MTIHFRSDETATMYKKLSPKAQLQVAKGILLPPKPPTARAVAASKRYNSLLAQWQPPLNPVLTIRNLLRDSGIPDDNVNEQSFLDTGVDIAMPHVHIDLNKVYADGLYANYVIDQQVHFAFVELRDWLLDSNAKSHPIFSFDLSIFDNVFIFVEQRLADVSENLISCSILDQWMEELGDDAPVKWPDDIDTGDVYEDLNDPARPVLDALGQRDGRDLLPYTFNRCEQTVAYHDSKLARIYIDPDTNAPYLDDLVKETGVPADQWYIGNLPMPIAWDVWGFADIQRKLTE